MNENQDTHRKSEELSWLENLQRNSWEPEVIISGIILAFLFIFPTKIYEFCAYLTQDFGLDYLYSSILLIYLTGIISIFKIFFVVHLALRFLWAGLLGLSYAYPNGVIQEKLFKMGQGYDYQKPDKMVLKLEKICSSAFAFPVSMVIVFFGLTLYLGVLFSLYVWLELNFIQIYGFMMFSLMIFLILMMSKRKTKFKSWYSQTMVSSINAIYQSNTGKWFSTAYTIFIMALAIPIIASDTQDFFMFRNEYNVLPKELEWPAKHLYFEDNHDPATRFSRAFLPQEEISENYIRIGLARYEGDRKVLEAFQSEFSTTTDTLNWIELNETADLHRIYVNDSLVQVNDWGKYRLSPSGQKVYQSIINLEGLKPGRHKLRVEKLFLTYHPFTGDPQVKLLENWANFEFIKK